MSDEEPVPAERIKEMILDASIEAVRRLCAGNHFWNPSSEYLTYGSETDRICKKYLTYTRDELGCYKWTGIRWDRIRGKKRKILKFEIKKARRRVLDQYSLWNRYAGQDGVLYIHARMGSHSWTDSESRRELYTRPWVLGYADDYWDRSYCDIYAKVSADVDAG